LWLRRVASVVSSRVITCCVATLNYLVIQRSIFYKNPGSLVHNDLAQNAKILKRKIAEGFRLDRSPLIFERRHLNRGFEHSERTWGQGRISYGLSADSA
jgi:hypothetical protein